MQKLSMKSSEYPQIAIRVSNFEFKRFKELKESHGLSARQVLEYAICPCDRCKGIEIIAFDKTTGEYFEIPRNILSKKP